MFQAVFEPRTSHSTEHWRVETAESHVGAAAAAPAMVGRAAHAVLTAVALASAMAVETVSMQQLLPELKSTCAPRTGTLRGADAPSCRGAGPWLARLRGGGLADEPAVPPLRFSVGDRVMAKTPEGWRPGTIVQLMYREDGWPEDKTAPYQIELDDSALIYAQARAHPRSRNARPPARCRL